MTSLDRRAGSGSSNRHRTAAGDTVHSSIGTGRRRKIPVVAEVSGGPEMTSPQMTSSSVTSSSSQRHQQNPDAAVTGQADTTGQSILQHNAVVVVNRPEITSSTVTSSSSQQRQQNASSSRSATLHSDAPVIRRVTVIDVPHGGFQSPDALRPPGQSVTSYNAASKVIQGDPSNPDSRGVSGGVSAAPSTVTRTYGPACVTVTPLKPLDQCRKFPVPDRSRQRQLDAVDLLRSEYETSFGGEVNPLLLYSSTGGASGEQEVNLSKQTVYDNVQYFNM